MARRWTEAQKQAIKADNKRVLVSAAAGSGKTSVLIARVMRLIDEGMSLKNMLVITFTKAAATEMRERLMDALMAGAATDPRLKDEYHLISQADIATLHSACGRIIRGYFTHADTDPLSRTDEVKTRKLLDQAVTDALHALYESPDLDDRELIDNYTNEQIDAMARKLRVFLMSQRAPWDWVAGSLTLPELADFRQSPWFDSQRQEAWRLLRSAQAKTEAALLRADEPMGPAAYATALEADRLMVAALMAQLEEQGCFAPQVKPEFAKLSAIKKDSCDPALQQAVKDLREEAKKDIKAAIKALPASDSDMQLALSFMQDAMPATRALVKLTRAVQEGYSAAKDAESLWDFDDMEHLALRAIAAPSVRDSLARHYQAVFVDEYQDISDIQQAIIDGLSGIDTRLFMVGDVKQSIYRFRQAKPQNFIDKLDAFGEDDNAAARLITLSDNFRSRPNILQAVNHVFELAMQKDLTQIAYDDKARLYPGRQDGDGPAVEWHLIDRAEPEEPQVDEEDEGQDEAALFPDTAVVTEARLIARRIKALLGTPLLVDGETRPLRFRDCVILLRSATNRATDIVDTLTEEGIPVYSQADKQITEMPDVIDMVNLLSAIDNPLSDEALLPALAAPPFALTGAQLADVALARGEGPHYGGLVKLAEREPSYQTIIDRLNDWRFLCQHSALPDFLHGLMHDSGLYWAAGAKPLGKLRQASLRLLCERAGGESAAESLSDFLEGLKDVRRQDSQSSASALGADEDVVTIMTMHKSKGLEFPVVILPGLCDRIRLSDKGETLVIDSALGLGLTTVKLKDRLKWDHFGVTAIRNKENRETRAEEARLLYVAMTRAKERLIMVSSHADLQKDLSDWAQPGAMDRAGEARRLADWPGWALGQALADGMDKLYTAPNGSLWDLHFYGSGDLAGEQPAFAIAENPALLAMRALMARPEVVEAPLDVAPPRRLNLKTSVTALARQQSPLFNDEAEEETAETKRHEQAFAPGLRDISPLPEALGQKTLAATDRGSAAHKLLGAVDLSALRGLSGDALTRAIAGERDRLCEKGLLTSEEAQAIRLGDIVRFFDSPLGQKLLNAQRVEREWAFTYQAEEGLIVQGVIDCCFKDAAGWVMVDYKTDRAEPQEIKRRYAAQMGWYARAFCDITGERLDSVCLYALRHGETILLEAPGDVVRTR